MAKVNEIMGDSDTAGIVDRKGKLLPLLKPWPGPDPDPMRVPSSAPQATLSEEVTEAAVTTDEERANTHRATQESIDRAMETSRGIPDPDDPTTGGEAATISDAGTGTSTPSQEMIDALGDAAPHDSEAAEGYDFYSGLQAPETIDDWGPELPAPQESTEQLLNQPESSWSPPSLDQPLAVGGAEAPDQGPGSGAGQPIDWDTPTGPGTSGPDHDLPDEDFPDQPDDVLPEDY
jgi:hypothetical protein